MRVVDFIIAIFMTLGIALATSQAVEEKRVKVFEMAESGQTFEFPMSREEIASEDTENARLSAMRQARLKKSEERRTVIEMGESAQTVEFPMSPAEIAAEDAENARFAAIRQAKLKKPQKQAATFELAESGVIIEFPVNSSENQDK